MIFASLHRPLVKREYPNMNASLYNKVLGEIWATLDINKKSTFIHVAAQVKRSHQEAFPGFQPNYKRKRKRAQSKKSKKSSEKRKREASPKKPIIKVTSHLMVKNRSLMVQE